MLNIITDDQVKLCYRMQGSGTHNFLLIHGTGADHRQLQPQMDYFSLHGQVLAVDLRGHGQSEKPKQEYTMEIFAKDLAFLCEKLEFTKPIVIGASMGGNIAIEIAANYPDLVMAIALLDSSFLYPAEFLDAMEDYSKKLHSDQYQACIDEIVSNSMLATDQHRDKVKSLYSSTPQYVWSSCLDNMIAWDKVAITNKLKKINVPMLYIEAHNRLVNLKKYMQLCPKLIYGKVVGAGHLISLETPEQVNPMLERFIQVYCLA